MSTTQDRRSSIINIDEWLEKCPGDEPDSMLYDPECANEIAISRVKEISPEVEALYKTVVDVCSQIGLPTETMHERLNEVDDCITTYVKSLQRDVQNEFDNLCTYKKNLIAQVQKMTSDLYLPPYEPEDNITLLQHCKRLKTQFNKLNVVKEKRMIRLKELRDKQISLCSILGIETPHVKMQTDIPTEEELNQLASTIIELEKEKERRKEKYKLLKDMISKCIDHLELPPIDFGSQPSYTDISLKKLQEHHSKLEIQFTENQLKFEKLRERLISLYDRLDIPKDERDAFLESHNVCKPSLMAELEVEIERYEELKKQNIGKFIEKIKYELVLEYERCFMSQEQQDAFISLSSEPSEELLELFEKELTRLKEHYEANREMLDKFHRWRLMWKELIDLEVKASDPNRFNNRGGQLLAEERKRKTLQKGLPKIENELNALNSLYFQKNGSKFKVFGTDVDEFMKGCWDELNSAKEEEKRERQRAKMTPNKKNLKVPAKATPLKRAVNGGSRLLGALSISEQEFEDMVVARPTSAKRPAARNFGK